jgi:hypothetical protein
MAGLFTLDSESLGQLDTDVLGGQGTGFVIGESTSTGEVVGVQGFTGSASGSSTTTGSALGAVAFVGSVVGSSVSTGSVVGVEGNTGSVTGVSVSTGTADGTPALVGSVDGESVGEGAGAGSPALGGNVVGVSVSTGSASGSPDGPPPPPPPEPEVVTGHLPFFQYVPRPQPIRPRPQQPQPTMHTGGAKGNTQTFATVVGALGYAGKVSGSQTVSGQFAGVRYPSDELVARWARQLIEHELLTLELL